MREMVLLLLPSKEEKFSFMDIYKQFYDLSINSCGRRSKPESVCSGGRDNFLGNEMIRGVRAG
ncbi:MAG TPA: hypothetical protein VM123_07935, partial [archaeon]|nr:hypothetical protein [archaeon]